MQGGGGLEKVEMEGMQKSAWKYDDRHPINLKLMPDWFRERNCELIGLEKVDI